MSSVLDWVRANPDRAAMIVIASVNLLGGLLAQFSPRAAAFFRAAGPDLVGLVRACLPQKGQ